MVHIKDEIGKVYWSIGEIAEELGINTSKIRFWEMQFRWLRPRRNRKANRAFTDNDIKILKVIYFFKEEFGMTDKGIIQAHKLGYLMDLYDYANETRKLALTKTQTNV